MIVGSALALLAGSLVPLRGTGAGDQLTTFAAFAALAVAMSLVTGLTAPRLVALGVPDPLVVGLVTTLALGGGLAGLRRPCSERRADDRRDGLDLARSRRRSRARAADRRGSRGLLATERKRRLRARPRRKAGGRDRARAGRGVLAHRRAGASRRAAVRLASQPARARQRRAGDLPAATVRSTGLGSRRASRRREPCRRAVSRRRALDTESVGRALVSSFVAVLPRSCLVG